MSGYLLKKNIMVSLIIYSFIYWGGQYLSTKLREVVEEGVRVAFYLFYFKVLE